MLDRIIAGGVPRDWRGWAMIGQKRGKGRDGEDEEKQRFLALSRPYQWCLLLSVSKRKLRPQLLHTGTHHEGPTRSGRDAAKALGCEGVKGWAKCGMERKGMDEGGNEGSCLL